MFAPIADHRHTITTIDVQFDPRGIRTWLSCALNDRKMLLLATEASLPGAGVLGQADTMIVLFTDFGLEGPYTGQMKTVLHQMAPGVAVIDLFADAPVGNPKASAYLLAAYAEWFAAGTTFLCVVDPGVGGTRPPVIVEADGRWYVGPGNGLFELIERRAAKARSWDIDFKPARLSASFHGRDLFAPVAACWRAASRRRGKCASRRPAAPTGRTTSPKSSTWTISATP